MIRAVKGMGVALLTLVLIALSAWGVLAIYYSDLPYATQDGNRITLHHSRHRAGLLATDPG